jgi:AcrR family transcriptional regulator
MDTQQKILDAAAQVFAEKGYHDTRVDEIVSRSATSKGAVYHYFRSKKHIFFALIDEFVTLLEKRLRTAIEKEESGIERVGAALEAGMATFQQYRVLAKIVLVQAVGLGTAFEEKRAEIDERFILLIREYLDEAIAEGSIPPLDTEVAARAWMGALDAIVIRWIYTGEPDIERAFPVLRDLLLRSVGVSEERIRSMND